MTTVAWGVIGGTVVLGGYTYVAYPALLWIARMFRQNRNRPESGEEWPTISIIVPAFNEERSLPATLDRIVEADYPADRRQILVVSDASTDGTDDIVRSYADRGVELLRLAERSGKTAAENASLPHLRGSVIINTDASVRVHPGAFKALVAALRDPAVGLASGRDVSMTHVDDPTNVGETGYVNYEMRIRDLETQVRGIVGASGCLYAVRAGLHKTLVPEALSRDFAAAMIAREHGYQAVSVWDAVCYVPRVSSLRREFRRKVRTITRGIETLYYKRSLLNPLQQGLFAWMLFSHKVCRWLVPWALVASGMALVVLAPTVVAARWGLVVGGAVVVAAVIAWFYPEDRPLPRALGVPAYAFWGNLAVLRAWIGAVRGELNPVWEPTRRDG